MTYSFPVTIKTPILAGIGVAGLVGTKLKEMGATNIIIICDKGIKNAGVADIISGYIKDAGLKCFINDEVLPDPPTNMIDSVAKCAIENKADGIVAVGGGSTMDTGKVVSIILSNGGCSMDWFNNFTTPQKKDYPLITIPTTSGTGAEITPGVVATNVDTGIKGYMLGTATISDFALIDPTLTVGVPPYATAACAFDVLGHAIDSMISKKTDLTKQAISTEAIRLLLASIHECYYNGKNVRARAKMHVASNLAGISLACANGTGSHSFSHALAATKHVPHGNGVAIFTPAFIEWMAPRIPEETLAIADALGIDYHKNDTIEDIAKRAGQFVYALAKSVDLPWIRDFYDTPEEAYEIIPLTLVDRQTANMDAEFTEEDGKWIINRTFEMDTRKK